MKSKIPSNPYGLESIKEREELKNLEKERIEKTEYALEEMVNVLKNIGNGVDNNLKD